MSYYMMGTMRNDKGNTVFCKERVGKEYLYEIFQCEEGVPFSIRCPRNTVTKEWIIRHVNYIANVGVSGDSIYPVEPKIPNVDKIASSAAVNPEELKKTISIIEEFYNALGNFIQVSEDGSVELGCALDGVYNTVFSRKYKNPFDIKAVYDDFSNVFAKDVHERCAYSLIKPISKLFNTQWKSSKSLYRGSYCYINIGSKLSYSDLKYICRYADSAYRQIYDLRSRLDKWGCNGIWGDKKCIEYLGAEFSNSRVSIEKEHGKAKVHFISK